MAGAYPSSQSCEKAVAGLPTASAVATIIVPDGEGKKEADLTSLNTRLEREGAQSGALTISLMWNDPSDLDLHAYVTKSGESRVTHIFYQNKKAAGGYLDVDMNASETGSGFSLQPVENIFWKEPPAGTYSICVCNYTFRGSPTQWDGKFADLNRGVGFKVFVNRKGDIQEFAGTWTEPLGKQEMEVFKFELHGAETSDGQYKVPEMKILEVDTSRYKAASNVPVQGVDSQDPAYAMRNGSYSMQWKGKLIIKFREVKVEHVRDANLALPTLYLHFLDKEFRMDEEGVECLDSNLRSGNDNSEVIVKLPSEYCTKEFAERCGDLQVDVEEVIKALVSQGGILVCDPAEGEVQALPSTLFYSLKCARAKAPVNLDRKKFGIPEGADLYLFVNNHSSVAYFDDKVKQAFNACIGGLAELEFSSAKKFCTFLKVFYEGGFGYNKKVRMGGGYIPVNIGTAAMNVVPAFDGQLGIGTGYPYKLPAQFLQFTETNPISIDAIRSMSEYHGRYGLAFTRAVYVWEGDVWGSEETLDFCSILPYGGFFYVPDSLGDFRAKGGLVYAFGEAKEDVDEAAELS